MRSFLLSILMFAAVAAADEPLKIHFISGSKEYKSEPSLQAFQKHLEGKFNITVSASWVEDGAQQLPEADQIPKADLLLVFARRMKLPEDTMAVIRAHWEAGKPIIGIRTSSHAFSREDNAIFDIKVMGGNYQGHFGNEPVVVEATDEGEDHPLLEGVVEITSGKLYKAGPLAGKAVALQTGRIEGKADSLNDVTWIHEFNGGRMFYTSLGVPSDFEDEDFLRLLENAIFWTTQKNRDDFASAEP